MAEYIVNADAQPIFRLNFANGWTASALQRWKGDTCNVALACWPTNSQRAEAGKSEASDDEVAAYFAEVAARPKAE